MRSAHANFTAGGPSILTKALNSESTFIDLSEGNVLDAALLKKLCVALETNESVTHLNIANNLVGDEGCDAIGILLGINPRIIALNLSGCGISDLGACCILRCSRKFNKLQSINLSRNAIGDATLAELDRFVQNTDCLSELILTDTNITFKASVGFLETLLTNYTLLYCALPYTVGAALLAELKILLTRNWKRMTKLDSKVNALESVKECLLHETAVIKTQWKLQLSEDERCSGRARSLAPTVAEWRDESVQKNLMCLAVLDRKAKFQQELLQESRKVRQQTTHVSPRLPSPRTTRTTSSSSSRRR